MSAYGRMAGDAPRPVGHGTAANIHEEDDGSDHEAELVLGTNRSDLIETGGGPQEILALNGDDEIFAGGGPDVVVGGNGRDRVFAQGGPDTVSGDNGNDYLQGGGGPDELDGGNGSDLLIGCMARDILTGGNGPDVFVYRAASEAPAGGSGEDEGGEHEGGGGGHEEGDGCGGSEGAGGGPETITDFEPGLDRIDLSAIGTVQAFSGGTPAANSVWIEQDGADVIVRVDTDGNLAGEHPEEMLILLQGVQADEISTDDFIF